MRRILSWLLLLAAFLPSPGRGAPTSTSSGAHMVIAVIAADKDSTFQMAELVRRVRDSNNFSKDHIPIARVPATQLRKEDFDRVGISPSSLPVVALMRISSADNLESVWGTPPAIVRNVQRPEVAAQIIMCRWAEFASVKLPPALESVAQIYQPFRIFVLNTGQESEPAMTTAQELAKLKSAEGISDKDLPVLTLPFGEGIMTKEDYTRLGFGADALPAVCLVKMSDCGNPTSIVGDGGLLRWSHCSLQAAREVVRQWSRLKGVPLKTIPPTDPFSISDLFWVDTKAQPVPSQIFKFCYLARNFRFGPGGRVWLQEEARILASDGAPVPALGGQSNHRWDSLPQATEVWVESSILLPSAQGQYVLEITTRDKQSNARVQLTLPFQL